MKPISETVYENKSVRFVLTTSVRGVAPGIHSTLAQEGGPGWFTVIATQSKGRATQKALDALHRLARVECEPVIARRLSALVRETGAHL